MPCLSKLALEVLPGEYNFYITETGKAPADAMLSLSGFNLAKNKYYTAVAFDGLASIRYLWLEDNYLDLAEGNIRVRAIHATPKIGQVDIWALSDSAEDQLLVENVDFGIASNPLDLPADTYKLGFDVNNDRIPEVTFALPALSAGNVVNLFVSNSKSGSVFLLAQFRDGTVAKIEPQ